MTFSFWLIEAETLSPLVIPRFRGNLSLQQTLDFVPGPTFRGALAYALAHAAGQGEGGILFSRFRRDRIQVTPLLPQPAEGGYGLPIPFSAWKCKVDRSHPVVDMMSRSLGPASKCVRCNVLLEPYGTGFMKADLNAISVIPVMTAAGTHVEIDDNKGISRKEVLFSLESINPGQCFTGFVKFTDPDDEAECWKLIEKNDSNEYRTDFILGIGQGPSRGRGLIKAKIERYEAKDFPARINAFNGGNIETRLNAYNKVDEDSDERATRQEYMVPVTMISNALLLQDNMTYTTGLNQDYFKACLGLDALEVKLKNAFTALTLVSGWNREHGRQKIQEPAIAMGSTFLFKVSLNGIDSTKFIEALTRMEQDGLGIRRHEGFGRVVIAHPFHIISSKDSAFPQISTAARARERRVNLKGLLPSLPVFIRLAAFRRMEREFSLNSPVNIRFLKGHGREIEIWCQDAARRLRGTDMDNRIKRLAIQGKRDLIKDAWILNDAGEWTNGDLEAPEWLKARLGEAWGEAILKDAVNLMANEFSTTQQRLNIDLEKIAGGYKLELSPSEEEPFRFRR